MKELGYIELWPICLMPAVTLWKIGPFRRILYRDFLTGKCVKLGPAWERWKSNIDCKFALRKLWKRQCVRMER